MRGQLPLVPRLAALSLLLWAATAVLVGSALLFPCRSAGCVVGLFACIFWLPLGAAFTSACAGLGALGQAVDRDDWLSAASLLLLLALAGVVGYALLQNGVRAHPVITAIYGFPPERFGLHPFAYYGSLALAILAVPMVGLGYSLARGQARQSIAVAGLVASVVLLVAIRLTA